MLARKISFLDANTGPIYRDGIGERHVLSPRIQYEQRLGATERTGIERALLTAQRTRRTQPVNTH